jgi:2-amino-4-hydroxy-6-hydroxymethyldihydropteridine diphosphokinase
MARIYLALGSNLGDRLTNLQRAVSLLQRRVRVLKVSDVYETEPWGVTDQPRFLNCALEGETTLTPPELLEYIKSFEQEMGRTASERYGPRVIDVDILLYDELIYLDERLEIPHPRMSERRFVLVPLAQLAPDTLHPVKKETMAALLARLPDEGDVRLYAAKI